jgi:hypothetical protein
LLPLVQQGKAIRIIGWELTGPHGTILETTKITATPSGETVDIASLPLPPRSNAKTAELQGCEHSVAQWPWRQP